MSKEILIGGERDRENGYSVESRWEGEMPGAEEELQNRSSMVPDTRARSASLNNFQSGSDPVPDKHL